MFESYPVTKSRLIAKLGYTEGEVRARHAKWKALGLYWSDPGGKSMYDLRGIQRWARSSNQVSATRGDDVVFASSSGAQHIQRRSKISATANRLI